MASAEPILPQGNSLTQGQSVLRSGSLDSGKAFWLRRGSFTMGVQTWLMLIFGSAFMIKAPAVSALGIYSKGQMKHGAQIVSQAGQYSLAP